MTTRRAYSEVAAELPRFNNRVWTRRVTGMPQHRIQTNQQTGNNQVRQNVGYNNNFRNHCGNQGNIRHKPDSYHGYNGHNNHRVITDNVDFGKITKALFRKCQLTHHDTNWESLPHNLAKQFQESFRMITPPNPGTSLTDELNAIHDRLSQDVLDAVHKHLRLSKLETDLTLRNLNPKNGDQAAFIAERQLSRFGKKMTKTFVKPLILEGLSILGDNFVISPVADFIEPMHDSIVQPIVLPTIVLPSSVLPVTSTPRLAPRCLEFPAKMDSVEVVPHTPKRAREEEVVEESSPQLEITSSKSKLTCVPPKKKFITSNTLDESGNEELDSIVQYISDDQVNITPVSRSASRDPSHRFSSKSTRIAPTNVTICNHTHTAGDRKDSWSLTLHKNCNTLVIGDSNLKLATYIPKLWSVSSYSGMHFKHLADVIDTYKGDPPKNVVFTVGINHRGDDFKSITSPQMDKVKDSIDKMFPQANVYAVGISTNSCISNHNENIDHINHKLLCMFTTNFIPKLNKLDVCINRADGFGIHHLKPTVDLVINSIKKRLN